MSIDLQNDMDNIFLDCGFEENIVYTPSGGSAKTIEAQVYRQGSLQTSKGSRTGMATQDVKNRMYDVEIDISTDPTTGVSKVTLLEDTVTMKARIGDTTDTVFTVQGIVQNDAGAFRLGLKP